MTSSWTRVAWERSVTSKAWANTPYSAGWSESVTYGEDLSKSPEAHAIWAEEMALGIVPDWAEAIIARMIDPLPSCGHYTFPRPLEQICEAIGQECCPEFVVGCYTADGERKRRMAVVIYCLDAWLQRAPLEAAMAEMSARDERGLGWSHTVEMVHRTLGEHTESRQLLVRRLIHRLRWWNKVHIWFDDRRDLYHRDAYLGDVRGDEEGWGAYGNSPHGDPYFAELRVPAVAQLSERIVDVLPDGRRLLDSIESTWLCAPKAFRYVERIVQDIGRVGGQATDGQFSPILGWEDTNPDIRACSATYRTSRRSLERWLAGGGPRDDLGAVTPVKHWLVRLLLHKLTLYERHCNFGKLVGRFEARIGGEAARG